MLIDANAQTLDCPGLVGSEGKGWAYSIIYLRFGIDGCSVLTDARGTSLVVIHRIDCRCMLRVALAPFGKFV